MERSTKKIIVLAGIACLSLTFLWCKNSKISPEEAKPHNKLTIVGGGIIGAFEAYQSFLDAQKKGERIRITLYDKDPSAQKDASVNLDSTNTSFNIVPSLTVDEILSVVPRGTEMVEKLALLFSEPGGIRVDDVPKVNESAAALRFKEEVEIYGSDENHNDRTETLLELGKLSMQLWQNLYDTADKELKQILEESNFNPCGEIPKDGRKLHQGYRIDLLYGIKNVRERAQGMQATYEKLGYKNCKVLEPDEVIAIDSSLTDFCNAHSVRDGSNKRLWHNDGVALWRPGGCIDSRIFLPKFYAYLKKIMGTYKNKAGNIKLCFRQKFKEVSGIEHRKRGTLTGLKFSDGSITRNTAYNRHDYVFCPGEAIGTLHKLGFQEPAYAGFAGPTLRLQIPIPAAEQKRHKDFNHCMEVHREGIVLAWQARINGGTICIGVGGTKAFYGDQLPHIDEAFALNRHLVQLNMINDVLPEFVSLATGRATKGKKLTFNDLSLLEKRGFLERWVGRRAVAYDGFPTLGHVYIGTEALKNARCTTHLGSGGVSFALGVVKVSRSCSDRVQDLLISKVLKYAESRRTARKKSPAHV